MDPVKYVYSFNRGVIIDKEITFTTDDSGDQAYGDQLVFTLSKNCSKIDFSVSSTFVSYPRFQNMIFDTLTL